MIAKQRMLAALSPAFLILCIPVIFALIIMAVTVTVGLALAGKSSPAQREKPFFKIGKQGKNRKDNEKIIDIESHSPLK